MKERYGGTMKRKSLYHEMSALFVCLFQPLSSTKTDRGARKYPLKWQWCE